jgi:hypothetical protein
VNNQFEIVNQFNSRGPTSPVGGQLAPPRGEVKNWPKISTKIVSGQESFRRMQTTPCFGTGSVEKFPLYSFSPNLRPFHFFPKNTILQNSYLLQFRNLQLNI